MTFADLKTEIFRRAEESATSPVYWDEDDVEDALEDAWDEVAWVTKWHRSRVSFQLQASKTYYDLRDLAPEDVIAVRRVFAHASNRFIQVGVSMRELDYLSYARWEASTGTPQHVFQRGAFQLGFHPKQGAYADTAHNFEWVSVDYDGVPELARHPSYVIPFGDEFAEALISGAMSEMFSQDGEVDLAVYHYSEMIANMAKFGATVGGRHRADRVSVGGM